MTITKADLATLLHENLGVTKREAAQKFAVKYRGFDPKQVVARISRKVGTYCGSAGRPT